MYTYICNENAIQNLIIFYNLNPLTLHNIPKYVRTGTYVHTCRTIFDEQNWSKLDNTVYLIVIKYMIVKSFYLLC